MSDLSDCPTCSRPMLSEHDYECATCGIMASEHISITSMCKVLRAVTSREASLIVANRELQDEVNEQCLLLGKSSERECVLRGRLEQLQRKRDVDHAIATRLAEALLLTFKHWINTDEAKESASALAAWRGGSAMSRTHDVTISAFDLDRLERELAAVTEQRDRLAESLRELCETLLKGNPRDITDLLNKAGGALAAVKGGNDE